MDNKLITVIITLVIGVIMAGSVLVPVLKDATTTEKTFNNANDGYYTLALNADDETTYSLTYLKSKPGILEINGTEYNANAAYGGATTSIVIADDWILRYNSTLSEYGYCQYYDGTNWAGNSTTKSLSMTASEGVATIVVTAADDSTTTKTASYTTMYGIAPNSDYVMKAPTQKAYLLGDSSIVAEGITTGTASGNVDIGSQLIRIDGTIDDGVTITTSNTNWSVSNIVIHKTEVAGYNDLYQIEKITFDLTKDESVYNATYSFFIVPSEVTAELSQHLTPGQIALMSAIPIMVIIALIMVAVGVFARRND